MKYDPSRHHRQSYRFQRHDYSSAAAYYVTLVTKNRLCLFGSVVGDEVVFSDLGKIADEFFRAIPQHFQYASIDIHQVMPNHVHAVIVIADTVGATHWVAPTRIAPKGYPRGPQCGSIGAMLGSYKMAVTRQAIARFELRDVWQRNYHDHIIRTDQEWQIIRNYIQSNPSQWLSDEEYQTLP